MLHSLLCAFLHRLPQARRFLQLSLGPPLHTVLCEASLNLSVAAAAAVGDSQLADQRRHALAATCELFVGGLGHHTPAVPRAVLRIAGAIWGHARALGLQQAQALALVAQAVVGCWLAPAVGAPEA